MCCRSSSNSKANCCYTKAYCCYTEIKSDENCDLFWEDVKQKATKLDVDAPKLYWKRRAPTRTEELFGGKSAPDYDNDVISNYYRT